MAKSRHRPPVLTEEELATERWAPVSETEGRYEVSDLGRVRTVPRGNRVWPHVLHPAPEGRGVGYMALSLLLPNGRSRHFAVHRLVARVFLPAGEGREVNHINGNRYDNRALNLEWVTKRRNMKHSSVTGLTAHGERHWRTHLTGADVLNIRTKRIAGETYIGLAEAYNISPDAARDIAIGRTWRHIPGPVAERNQSPLRVGRGTMGAQKARLAKRLIACGWGDTEIGALLGASSQAISSLARGLTWAHLA